jgi:hypothetical protein
MAAVATIAAMRVARDNTFPKPPCLETFLFSDGPDSSMGAYAPAGLITSELWEFA